ncbi:MAG: hypothetical protein EXS58_00020 [Candidatus Latescibacteria bacterium]|nr:hypothetical protein [Candidatus Latescibacterota bacterium]
MDWSILLMDFVPLLVFVVVDSLSNMRRAVVWALAVAGVELIWEFCTFGEIDEFSMLSTLLILIFGGLALKYNNALFIKFKPVILSLFTALALLITWGLGKPLLVTAMDRYGPLLPAQFQPLVHLPRMQEILARATLYLGFGFLLHAGVVAWAALRLGSWGWLLTRSAGAYLMMFVALWLAAR